VSAVLVDAHGVTRTMPLSDAVEFNPKPDRGSIAAHLEVSFVPMAAVEAGSGRMDPTQARPYGEVKKGFTYFCDGDVLFAKITPCMENGKMAVAHGLRNGIGFGSTEFHVLRPRVGVDARYVYHFVASATYRRNAAHHMTGAVGQKRVPLSYLQQSELPLPPIKEQHRIVAEIEKQFSRLDEAVANLQRVKANLKRYEAAVLNVAVQGRLVPTEAHVARNAGRGHERATSLLAQMLRKHREQWSGRGAYQEPGSPDSSHLPPLPDSWAWASIEQVASGERYALSIGPFGSSLKVSDYESSGVPLVFVRNIRARNFRDEDAVFVSTEKAAELCAHWVASGDLLITKMGAPPGDVCVYPPHRPAAVITADCIKLRSSTILTNAKYLEIAIAADVVQKQIAGITQGVAQQKISLGRFSTIAVPLPPLAEQHRIVTEVDRRLSIVREVEAEVDANLKRAQALRQAVLARAFRHV
jgi:type I restriction enzyme, S subunit